MKASQNARSSKAIPLHEQVADAATRSRMADLHIQQARAAEWRKQELAEREDANKLMRGLPSHLSTFLRLTARITCEKDSRYRVDSEVLNYALGLSASAMGRDPSDFFRGYRTRAFMELWARLTVVFCRRARTTRGHLLNIECIYAAHKLASAAFAARRIVKKGGSADGPRAVARGVARRFNLKIVPTDEAPDVAMALETWDFSESEDGILRLA